MLLLSQLLDTGVAFDENYLATERTQLVALR
jgi:hypothetical protein